MLLLLAWTAPAFAETAGPPNIVFIVVEDLGPRVASFGDPVAVTPNLDRLAAEGIRYTQVFTTAGVCAPSRAALITGMYQHSIGAQHMRTGNFGREQSGEFGTFSTPGPPYETVPPPYVKAFPEYLRAAGYFTINNAKTDYQFGAPFSVWDLHSRDATLEDRDPAKPFFAMYSSNITHESSLFREGFAHEGSKAVERNRDRLSSLEELTDPAKVTVPAYLPDTPDVRKDVARQYDNVRIMDAWVGERLSELENAGLLDNTIVIWTTDHGDGFPRAKRSLYDSGLHVPMIIRFPDGRAAGSEVDDLVSFIDLAPTILGLAGAALPAHLHGRDFLDRDGQIRTYIHAARDRQDEWPDRSRAVRDKRYKYIRNYVPERPFFAPIYYRENLASMAEIRRLRKEGQLAPAIERYFETPRPAEELYDLARDPDELVNLGPDPDHADTLERFRQELSRWQSRVPDTSTTSEEEMVTRLMWPGAVQPATASPEVLATCSQANAIVSLESPTTGASIEYRMATGKDHGWRLFTGRFEVEPGSTIEARAIRYGFRASEVARTVVC